MVADSTSSLIAVEIDMGFGYGRIAQAAYSAGRTLRGDAALQAAWAAWERAKSMVLKHEVEELGFKLMTLEGFLKGVEKKVTD